MVIPAGFEPTACRLGGDRSILLSYGTKFLPFGRMGCIIPGSQGIVNFLKRADPLGYTVVSGAVCTKETKSPPPSDYFRDLGAKPTFF